MMDISNLHKQTNQALKELSFKENLKLFLPSSLILTLVPAIVALAPYESLMALFYSGINLIGSFFHVSPYGLNPLVRTLSTYLLVFLFFLALTVMSNIAKLSLRQKLAREIYDLGKQKTIQQLTSLIRLELSKFLFLLVWLSLVFVSYFAVTLLIFITMWSASMAVLLSPLIVGLFLVALSILPLFTSWVKYSLSEILLEQDLKSGVRRSNITLLKDSKRLFKGYVWKKINLNLSWIAWYLGIVGIIVMIFNIGNGNHPRYVQFPQYFPKESLPALIAIQTSLVIISFCLNFSLCRHKLIADTIFTNQLINRQSAD